MRYVVLKLHVDSINLKKTKTWYEFESLVWLIFLGDSLVHIRKTSVFDILVDIQMFSNCILVNHTHFQQ